MIQVDCPTAVLRIGDRITLAKTEVASIEEERNWVMAVYDGKWYLAALAGLAVLLMVWRWFGGDELVDWMRNTRAFAKLLVPLPFGGVLVVGFIGTSLPGKQIASLVGDNSIFANLVVSVGGCLFFFAMLTEIRILLVIR